MVVQVVAVQTVKAVDGPRAVVDVQVEGARAGDLSHRLDSLTRLGLQLSNIFDEVDKMLISPYDCDLVKTNIGTFLLVLASVSIASLGCGLDRLYRDNTEIPLNLSQSRQLTRNINVQPPGTKQINSLHIYFIAKHLQVINAKFRGKKS